MNRFRSPLTQLTSAYGEEQQRIADMTVSAKQTLAEEGVDESVLSRMEGMDRLVVARRVHAKYAEYLAAYVVLRRAGQSRYDAFGGLEDIVSGLNRMK